MKFRSRSFLRKSFTAAGSILLLGMMLSGCASQNKCSYVSDQPIFFPPPPDEPHIQYLTGINSTDDIGTQKKSSGFSLFASGNDAGEIVKKIGKSYGIRLIKGKLYVVEGMNARIDIIDIQKGTFENPVGLQTPKGMLKYPVNMTLDDEGYMYVADTARKEIVVYDPSGNYAYALPEPWDKRSKIVDVHVHQGKLYALDLGAAKLRVLDRKTGEQISELGYIEKPDQSLRMPSNMVFDPKGEIYIANIGNNKVMKYDLDGNYLGAFGGSGDTIGSFVKPKGVALSPEGYLFIVDGGSNVVQVFDQKFRPLTYFGWPGLSFGSLNGPAGIAITTDHIDYFKKYAAPGFKIDYLVMVVSQFGQEYCIPRISVYGVGEMQKKK